MATVNVDRLEEMKALQAQLEALKNEASAELVDLTNELTAAIEGWGIHEVIPRLNYLLEKHGYSADYVGVVRPEAEKEIFRRVNTAPGKIHDLDQEELGKIAAVPDVNCRVEDVRRTLRHMVVEGIITTHNPENKKGRNSTYTIAPVSPATSEPVKGGKPAPK